MESVCRLGCFICSWYTYIFIAVVVIIIIVVIFVVRTFRSRSFCFEWLASWLTDWLALRLLYSTAWVMALSVCLHVCMYVCVHVCMCVCLFLHLVDLRFGNNKKTAKLLSKPSSQQMCMHDYRGEKWWMNEYTHTYIHAFVYANSKQASWRTVRPNWLLDCLVQSAATAKHFYIWVPTQLSTKPNTLICVFVCLYVCGRYILCMPPYTGSLAACILYLTIGIVVKTATTTSRQPTAPPEPQP